jgi:hypothetical protein
VEEEIPPSWQLTGDGQETGKVDAEEGNDKDDDGNDGAEDTSKVSAEEGNDDVDDGSHHTLVFFKKKIRKQLKKFKVF